MNELNLNGLRAENSYVNRNCYHGKFHVPIQKYKCGIVATGHVLVSGAAADILRAGGNAFDAAVAAGFAGAVCEQTLTSLGGGGFLLASNVDRHGMAEEIFFDFFVDTPGRGTAGGKGKNKKPHFFPVTVDFGSSTQDFNIGLGSVAVPGILKGLLHVHARLGRMELAEVLIPAMKYARGHELNDFQASFLELLRPIMTMTETGRSLYIPAGRHLCAGDSLHNLIMAGFLEQVVRDKGESFYRGDIARAIARDMRADGGLLSFDDLAAYQVIERKPLRASFRGRTLLTGPPPSPGGPLLALSLALLEEMGRPDFKWGSIEHLLQTIGFMKEVDSLREQGVSTPEELERFRKNGRISRAVENIRHFSRGTTHLSIADKDGNVASMTCSNGEGSGYFAPDTGVMLNNMMGEDDLHPTGFHQEPPGRRVGSMMSPSLLLNGSEVELVIGSGGSKRIRTAIIQTLTQIIDFHRSPVKAVCSSRLHWDGKTLQIEPGFGEEVLEALRERVPVNVWEEISVYFGGVHLVIPGQAGVGDPRRGGSVVVVEG